MPYIGTRRSIIQVHCGQLLGLRNAQYILAAKMKTALPSPSMAPTTVKKIIRENTFVYYVAHHNLFFFFDDSCVR